MRNYIPIHNHTNQRYAKKKSININSISMIQIYIKAILQIKKEKKKKKRAIFPITKNDDMVMKTKE